MAKQYGDKITREDGDACPRELCGGKLAQRQDGLMECSQCQFTWNREYRLNDPNVPLQQGAPPVIVPDALVLHFAEKHHEYMMEVAARISKENGEPEDPELEKEHSWHRLSPTLRQQHFDEAKIIMQKVWPEIAAHFRGSTQEPVVSTQAAEELRALLTEIAIPSLQYCEDKFGHDDQARLNIEAGLGMRS